MCVWGESGSESTLMCVCVWGESGSESTLMCVCGESLRVSLP